MNYDLTQYAIDKQINNVSVVKDTYGNLAISKTTYDINTGIANSPYMIPINQTDIANQIQQLQASLDSLQALQADIQAMPIVAQPVPPVQPVQKGV